MVNVLTDTLYITCEASSDFSVQQVIVVVIIF